MEKYMISEIAQWFLSRSKNISHKKLQKLVYYAEAWSHALFYDGLITDSEFEAWAHGPVSKVLYEKYREYGWNPIPQEEKPSIDETTEGLLQSVWVTYGDKSANELEALTHSELPWRKARGGLRDGEPCNNIISTKDMEEYYRSIYIGD